MQDIISLNRQFLLVAREAARAPSGEVVTGLSRRMLDVLSRLSIEQIEQIAQAGVSLVTLRLSEEELDRLIAQKNRPAYAIAVTACR